eukprot:305270-Prorocentrum_lima.AAC.1
MTSSLVGSEMCIRDSLMTAVLRILKDLFTQLMGAPRRAALETTTDLPVSYTHLTLPTICSV